MTLFTQTKNPRLFMLDGMHRIKEREYKFIGDLVGMDYSISPSVSTSFNNGGITKSHAYVADSELYLEFHSKQDAFRLIDKYFVSNKEALFRILFNEYPDDSIVFQGYITEHSFTIGSGKTHIKVKVTSPVNKQWFQIDKNPLDDLSIYEIMEYVHKRITKEEEK